MNFAVEIGYDNRSRMLENSSKKDTEYEIDLYIPELRIYLTSESVDFISNQTRKWIAILTEVIKSLIGQMPKFKI